MVTSKNIRPDGVYVVRSTSGYYYRIGEFPDIRQQNWQWDLHRHTPFTPEEITTSNWVGADNNFVAETMAEAIRELESGSYNMGWVWLLVGTRWNTNE